VAIGLASARKALTRDDVPPGSWIQNSGGTAALGIKVFSQIISPGLSWRTEFVRQYVFAFQATLLPATIVSFVVGFSTIGIQGGSLASAFGAVDRISGAAPIAFLRGLGPILTAAIVAGTLGATITAEIGARKIRQELLALEVLGISPVRNLIMPRVVGLALWMPVLALLTFWAGIAGTFAATVFLYGNTPQAFFDQLLVLTSFIDLWGSVVRLTLFGILIGLVAAYKGMQVGGGAEGVGKAVNESVVTSLVVVGVVTLVYTTLFEAFFPEVNFVL
jgi:phospholipid/cholesterol/gamma-HCH transport system permease protein